MALIDDEKPEIVEDPGFARASSDGESKGLPPIDKEAERKLRWKCDVRIIPMIGLLYMLSFVDRINIGNAKIQGLEKDLKMTGTDYNVALFVFFIPYILFEVPSNLILKKLAPSTWLSSIMLCWGIITVIEGVVPTYNGLVVCRFFLGVFEAGYVPGCIYLISMYYRRYEMQWRINLFFSCSIIAGAFAGLLAYAVANMAGIGGYNGWRWIFIIEGLITVVAAVIGKFLIADWPDTAKFLNEEERALLTRRLAEDRGPAEMNHLNKVSAKRAFSDWKIYVGTIMYFGVVNTGYATSFFVPTILEELGWVATRAQVMSIPIYIVSACFTLTTALLSDRMKHRFGFTILGIAIATVGYVILLAQGGVAVPARYMAVYFIVVGGYITQPMCIGWLSNSVSGHYKRSVASAMQIGFGNLGGIVASNIFLNWQAPRYPVGYGVSLGMLWICGIACCVFFVGLRRENKKRDRGERDDRLSLPLEERRNLGDDYPSFRFGY